MQSTKNLHESLEKFENKKQSCLAFLDKAIEVVQSYENEFEQDSKKEEKGINESGQTESFITSQTLQSARAKVEDASLKILISGQFKTGKSTTINALLGNDILPAYSTPCTAVITEVNYADKPRAELVFKDNLTDVPEDLCEKALEHINAHKPHVPNLELEASNPEELDVFRDELENYLVIPMNDKEQRESVAESPYALCKLFWPLELCKNGVEIIDSPGLNEAEERDKTTMDYVPKVDMVIHVLTALQCYGKPDANFDRDVKACGNPPIVFLINRFDQVNNDRERERIRSHVFNNLKLQEKTGDFGRNGVLFISAYAALTAREENDEAKFQKSGFSEFETAIANIVANQRMKIKFGHIRGISTELMKLSNNHIIAMRSLLDKNVADLEKKFEENKNKFNELEERKKNVTKKIEDEVASLGKDLNVSLRDFFYDFCDTGIEKIISGTIVPKVSIFTKEEDQKRIIEILDDTLKEGLKDYFNDWAEKEGKNILEERFSEIQKSINWELRQFSEQLSFLRRDLGLGSVNSSSLSDATDEEMIGAFLGGGAIGGVLSGGAVFLASRFLAVLAGPVGWVATGILTIGSALLALFNLNEAHEKIKSKYIEVAQKSIRSRIREMSNDISSDIMQEFSKEVLKVSDEMNKKIEGSKKTIEEAISQLKKNQSVIEEKKSKLDDYHKKITLLYEEGFELAESL